MDEQRTDEWFAARLGKVTASRVSDVIARTKSGYSTSRDNYMAQLIVERITGKQAESFSNAAMQWGTEQEPFARAAYEARTGVMVDEVGFIDHPSIPDSGASPDGLVEATGLVEIKCPNTATHIETLINGSVPSKYLAQMQWQMACTGREYCDFVSFDSRMPAGAQLWVKRVERDSVLIEEMEKEIAKFLTELASKVEKLKNLIGVSE
jgi:putative phage-type endonuclease